MAHDLYNATLFPALETWEPASDEALLPMESELLTPTVKARSVSFALTSRDLDIIYSVGTYKYLSIFQLQRLHFPFAQSYRAASNRIAALVSAGLLSRVFHHPRLTAHTGRPASILYLTSNNLDTLATLLARMSRASLFDRFHDIATTDRDDFAYSFIMHELGISDLYLALELSDRPDSLVFYFHEHDNNTETNLHNLYRKYAGYLAFHKERRFPDLLHRFLNKHGISIPDTLIARADFRVLTTAPDAHRRDKLIREVNKLDDCDRFYFADLMDVSPATIHTPIWRKASDYDPIAIAEKQLPKISKASVRARFIAERMPSLPTYALSD